MAAFIGTFERKETKYVIDAAQLAKVKEGLSGRLELDGYGATRIDSLYFDTPNRDLIARSLEKPTYKEKLRVRAYGDAGPDSPVFVELKKKFKGIVYKRRVRMSRAGVQAYFAGASYEEAQGRHPVGSKPDESAFTPVNLQIAREIDLFRTRYDGLAPSMLISCMREAWRAVDPSDPETDIRITFDEGISFVDVAGGPFEYEAAVACEGRDFALPCGSAVMEIKCAGAYPVWLARLLGECGIRPQSFSKYGASYAIASRRQCEEARQAAARRVATRRLASNAPKRAPKPQRDLGLSALLFPKRRKQAVGA